MSCQAYHWLKPVRDNRLCERVLNEEPVGLTAGSTCTCPLQVTDLWLWQRWGHPGLEDDGLHSVLTLDTQTNVLPSREPSFPAHPGLCQSPNSPHGLTTRVWFL